MKPAATARCPPATASRLTARRSSRCRPELSEYTDCPDLIHKAQLAGAAGSHGGPGAGGSGSTGAVAAAAVAPPTPTEQHALEGIPHAGAPPVHLGGEVIHPGVVHVNIASALGTLPAPLFALLAFLLTCALLLIGRAVRNRVHARHLND